VGIACLSLVALLGLPITSNSLAGGVLQSARDDGEGLASTAVQPKRAPWIRSFPLWMGVPTPSFAVLAEGTVRQERWGVYAFRGKGALAAQRPCIELGTLSYGVGSGGSFSTSAGCGPLAPPAAAPVIKQSGIAVQKKVNGPTVGDTVLAMTLAPSVAQVTVHLRPGPSRTLHTRLLSAKQAVKAHVRQFRYVVLALGHRSCVASVTGYNFAGVQVVSSPARSCQ
jgi:hypothetical protein